MQISEEIDIDAPASAVWQLLTDLDAYSIWNPFIREASGILAEGHRLRLSVTIPGGRDMTLRPKVIELIPEKELRWIGGLWVPGLFNGDHRFRIHSLKPGTVRFVQTEEFSGLLSPFFGGWVSRDALKGFQAMNLAMKKRLEGKTP